MATTCVKRHARTQTSLEWHYSPVSILRPAQYSLLNDWKSTKVSRRSQNIWTPHMKAIFTMNNVSDAISLGCQQFLPKHIRPFKKSKTKLVVLIIETSRQHSHHPLQFSFLILVLTLS